MKSFGFLLALLWGTWAWAGPGVCPDGRVAINDADAAAFQSLKGIGKKKAERIIAERKTAPFASPEALTRVKGIGPATVAKLRSQLTLDCGDAPAAAAPMAAVSPAKAACATPININTASPGELTSLKGIGKKKAARIVAKRDELKGFKSVDDLTQVKGIGKKTVEKLRPCLTLK